MYLASRYIGKIINAKHIYPDGKKKIWTIDNPEILLVSLIVVSAKLLYPMDGVERPSLSRQDPGRVKFDWKEWQNATPGLESERDPGLVRGEEHEVTPEKALSLHSAGLDDYMDWFEKICLDDNEPKCES